MKYIELPIQEIIKEYQNGMAMRLLAKKYNVSEYVIANRLKEYNIAQYNQGYFLRKNKNINESYFDNIDCERKAYFLGFLYADGCNHRNKKPKIDIALQEKDKLILEEMSIDIYGVNDNFLFRKKRKESHKNQYVLTIHSKKISDKLFELGCGPKKSLTLKFPEWLIDPELQKHFIRGYFDGDGCITFSKRKDRINDYTYKFSIVSTRDFCNTVSNIIDSFNIKSTYVKKHLNVNNNITTILNISGNRQIEKLMDWLYKDSTIYLQRKYDKYLQLKNWLKIIDERRCTHIKAS